MKKRFYIALALFLTQATTLLILGLALESSLRATFLLTFFIITFYLVIYFIGGLSKLFVNLIYGLGLFLLMYFFKDYRFAFVVIGTFIFLLNPLSYVENKLAKRLDNPDPIELQKLVKRSYYPYYDYRVKMKDYYHLPQTIKFYRKKAYYRLINITTFVLAGLGIFLTLMELNTMVTEIAALRLESILIFYVVIVIFVSALILYKKGFKSLRHFVTPIIFLPMPLLAVMTNLTLAWKISIASITGVAALLLIFFELYQYFQRVSYHSSNYLDSNNNHFVYANLLYEPYMFNEYYTLVGKYELRLDIETFHKKFQKILVYANFRMFFITSYVDTGSSIIIYTQFNKRHLKLPEKFSNYLEKVYETSSITTIRLDPSHTIYEQTFYRSDDYIVARAVTHGKMMKNLEINAPLIISMYFYFNNIDNLKEFIKNYKVDIISLAENVVTIKVEFEIVNVDYLIDLKVREILLNALIYEGTYIRITVATRGEINEN